MWFPWFQKLLKESHKTQEILQQQIASIRDASQAREEKDAEVGASIATAIKTAGDTVPEYERCQRKKEHRLQWGFFWVTLAGGLAAAVAAGGAWYYADIAKGQLGQMIEATNQAKRSADTAAWALRENHRQFVETSATNQTQFQKTLEQMKGQTTASQTAAVTAGKALEFNLNAAIAEKGEPRIVIDPWVAWYSGSLYCGDGQVCTRLTIHNRTKDTRATGLQIAVKIDILPSVPRSYPNNWMPVSPSDLGFSDLEKDVAPGYPNCTGCSSFWAHHKLIRKGGTVYVWGSVSYYISGVGDRHKSSFCFQATPNEVFGIGSTAIGFGKIDDAHKCPEKRVYVRQPF